MNEKKKKLLRIFFAGEIALFSILYFMGPSGVYSSQAIREESRVLETEIAAVESEIDALEKEINLVATDPFYKEKIAREQLQMAREHETIYLTD